MVILRNEELKLMHELIQSNPQGKYLITGPAGSGKTFFINILGQELQKAGMKIEPMPEESFFYNSNHNPLLGQDLDIIYLCDGLDEIEYPRHIYEGIRNSANGFVCTARNKDFDTDFDYELQLKPLNFDQQWLMVMDSLSNTSIDYNKTYELLKQLKQNIIGEVTPLLLNIFISYAYDKDLAETLAKILSENYQTYIYGKKVSLQSPKIIVPEKKIIRVPSELINDINIVNTSLLERVLSNPQSLYEMKPRQFEELVCELFQKKGYNVQLTKQTRDGGKDIIILNNDSLGDFIIYAECKRYAKTRPVGVSLVRQLYGTVEADKATAGIMVTTSTFTKEAREFRESVRGRMSLIDYTELMKQIIMFK